MTKQEEEALNLVLDACRLMNWKIATVKVTEENKNEEMQGFVIGTDEFIKEYVDKLNQS